MAGGRILVDGRDVTSTLSSRDFRRRVQMVFQDASSSLNPRLDAGSHLREALRVSGKPGSAGG